MPIIDVEGLGELEFPDGMSDADMEAAIKTHPNYPKPKSKGPQVPPLNANIVSVAQGIPILGRMIPSMPGVKEFQEENPKTTTGMNVGGALASTLPIGVATGAIAKGSTLADSALSAAAYGGIGMGDKLAEKGKDATSEEVRNAGIISAIAGAFGPILSKVISPNVIPKPTIAPKPTYTPKPMVGKRGGEELSQETINYLRKNHTFEEIADMQVKANATRAKQNAEMPAKLDAKHEAYVKDTTTKHAAEIAALKGSPPKWAKDIPYNLGGAALGHLATGGMGGAFAGAVAGPLIKPLVEKGAGAYWGNQVMQSPANQMFIKAIMGNAGINLSNE